MTIRWVPTISPATWPPGAAGLTVQLRRLTARASPKASGTRRESELLKVRGSFDRHGTANLDLVGLSLSFNLLALVWLSA